MNTSDVQLSPMSKFILHLLSCLKVFLMSKVKDTCGSVLELSVHEDMTLFFKVRVGVNEWEERCSCHSSFVSIWFLLAAAIYVVSVRLMCPLCNVTWRVTTQSCESLVDH